MSERALFDTAFRLRDQNTGTVVAPGDGTVINGDVFEEHDGN